jgi:hypothetical protein
VRPLFKICLISLIKETAIALCYGANVIALVEKMTDSLAPVSDNLIPEILKLKS